MTADTVSADTPSRQLDLKPDCPLEATKPPILRRCTTQAVSSPHCRATLPYPQTRISRQVRFNSVVSYVDHPSSEGTKHEVMHPKADAPTLDLAATTAVDWLQQGNRKQKAHAGLKDALQALISSAYTPKEGIERASEILDANLFNGKVSGGSILVLCDKISSSSMGLTLAPNNRYGAQAAIVIGYQYIMALQSDIRSYIVLLTLIHQMIHAYFLSCSGKQRLGPYADGRLKHGHHFWAVYFAIASILDGYDNTSRASSLSRSMRHLHWHGKCSRRPMKTPSSDLNTFDSTDCTLDTMPLLSRDEVELWLSQVRHHSYERTSKFVNTFNSNSEYFHTVERHEKGSLLDYYEVSWRSYSFPFGKGAIDDRFPSLMDRHFSDSKYVLKVPDSFPREDITRLLSFLKTGDYKPTLSAGQFSKATRTPALVVKDNILEQNGPTCPVNDIRAYHVAATIDFGEMQSHALRRLESHSFITTDPLLILSEIYFCGSSSECSNSKACADRSIPISLRNWARRFMMSSLSSQEGYSTSNMAAMEYLTGGLGLYGLVVKSSCSELAFDYQLVRKQLWENTEGKEKPTWGVWAGQGPPIVDVRVSLKDGNAVDLSSLIPPPPRLPSGQEWKRWPSQRFDLQREAWSELIVTC